MQFVWKYIDDLVGKGLEWSVIGELLLYQSASLVPIALPLAVLVSAIMTFGGLGERYELTALKASGISLIRIMSPLIVCVSMLSVGAFFFANNIIPVANLKSSALLHSITQQKPTLNLREGVFFTGIDGYSIKVGGKEKQGDSELLKDIIIYNHTVGQNHKKLITAQEGSMLHDEASNAMVLNLKNGQTFEEMKNKSRKNPTYPFIKSSFKEQTLVFDLSEFALQRTKEELFKDHFRMMSVQQLSSTVDSLEQRMHAKLERVKTRALKNFIPDSIAPLPLQAEGYWWDEVEHNQKAALIETAINLTRASKSYFRNNHKDLRSRARRIVRYENEWHRKFALSFACLILFFVGAPLGAIIRKGGMGMPFVISVLLFVLFHITSMVGEKLAREFHMTPFVGMWLSGFVLLPIGIFLTYKSTTDSTLFNIERYTAPITKALRFLKLNGN